MSNHFTYAMTTPSAPTACGPIFGIRTGGTCYANRKTSCESTPGSERRSRDVFREAAVLIAVLAPMELLVRDGSLTWPQAGLIVVLTTFCMVIGFYAGLQKNADE